MHHARRGLDDRDRETGAGAFTEAELEIEKRLAREVRERDRRAGFRGAVPRDAPVARSGREPFLPQPQSMFDAKPMKL